MAAHHLTSTIACHAWNKDRSMLALCPNTNEVWIFTGCKDPDHTKWTRKYILKEHDMLVAGLDWHPVTNRIVTASHDRNAFVWDYDAAKDAWKPTVVILAIDRAALDVKWSPDGTKFAVGSGNKQLQVCWYDEGNNWWAARTCKKEKQAATARSSVVAVAWHPNSQVIACASTDWTVRVLCAHVPEIDGEMNLGAQFGAGFEFGDTLWKAEITRAWVNDVAWSPSGLQLAFIGHDGLVHVAAFAPDGSAMPVVQTVKTTGLPAMRVLWLTESALVTAGHNLNADVFSSAGAAATAAAAGSGATAAGSAAAAGTWAFVGSCDVKPAAGAAGAAKAGASAFGSAKALFAAKVDKGMSGADTEASGTALWTKHQGAIMSLRAYAGSAGKTHSFSTSGNDGRVVVWDIKALPHLPAAGLGL